MRSSQGILTEGEERSVRLASLFKLVHISCIFIEKIFFPSYKTSYLKKEVNCTEFILSIRVPRDLLSLSHIKCYWGPVK